jgi:hypothetical protein
MFISKHVLVIQFLGQVGLAITETNTQWYVVILIKITWNTDKIEYYTEKTLSDKWQFWLRVHEIQKNGILKVMYNKIQRK